MMISSRVGRSRDGRADYPLWMVLTAVGVVVLVLFVGWVTLGMGSVPASADVTEEVPVHL